MCKTIGGGGVAQRRKIMHLVENGNRIILLHVIQKDFQHFLKILTITIKAAINLQNSLKYIIQFIIKLSILYLVFYLFII